MYKYTEPISSLNLKITKNYSDVKGVNYLREVRKD